ncbi:hypothetical protein [Pendulispora albinea]|uniref:Tryptophan synthase alpha chain n=1 Tax=Pendulispora albinea TaxID=2741071 RepID=A0ABZ2LVQ5_9BACT
MKNRFMPGVAIAAALLLPVLTYGCSDSDSGNPLCCNEFKVGATVDVNIGPVQAQVAAQAVADVSGIASAAIDDLTTACRGIAQDLDAPKTEQDKIAAEKDRTKQMRAWCSLAARQIGSFKGSATLKIDAKPPQCEASISAKADCQAKCSVDGKCDIKANPPTCTGGKLEISCKGSCSASGSARVSCEGKCEGTCQGSCTAKVTPIQCQGKCEGKCSAQADGSGNGAQADGSCSGYCSGTCSGGTADVKCEGTCNGSCSASCKAEANVAVKCDGKCDTDYEPISCTGGKLEGGCKVDAKCDANCDASVQAKASCTPPSVNITFNADADGKIARLGATLKANLPIIFSLSAKLKDLGALTGTISGNISAVADVKPACIPTLVAAAGQAVNNVGEAFKATGDISGSVGIN